MSSTFSALQCRPSLIRQIFRSLDLAVTCFHAAPDSLPGQGALRLWCAPLCKLAQARARTHMKARIVPARVLHIRAPPSTAARSAASDEQELDVFFTDDDEPADRALEPAERGPGPAGSAPTRAEFEMATSSSSLGPTPPADAACAGSHQRSPPTGPRPSSQPLGGPPHHHRRRLASSLGQLAVFRPRRRRYLAGGGTVNPSASGVVPCLRQPRCHPNKLFSPRRCHFQLLLPQPLTAPQVPQTGVPSLAPPTGALPPALAPATPPPPPVPPLSAASPAAPLTPVIASPQRPPSPVAQPVAPGSPPVQIPQSSQLGPQDAPLIASRVFARTA
ncbi:hypothetical protein Efla_001877 [Eimeria flavescens]